MKKLSTILTVLLVICNGLLYSQENPASLSFDERVFDFGNILERNGKVSHIFFFKNTGKTPVIINDIVSGCGCTNHEYSKKPIKPGEKGKITISYNPAYRPGFFSKEIVIFSNNRKAINRVWVKGSVIPFERPVEEDYPYALGNGLHTNLKVLSFGRIIVGKSKEIELKYANDTDKPMTLKFMVDSNNANITFTNPDKLEAKERGKMIVSYAMKKSTNKETIINIYPIVNGKKLSQPLQVKVGVSLTQ